MTGVGRPEFRRQAALGETNGWVLGRTERGNGVEVRKRVELIPEKGDESKVCEAVDDQCEPCDRDCEERVWYRWNTRRLSERWFQHQRGDGRDGRACVSGGGRRTAAKRTFRRDSPGRGFFAVVERRGEERKGKGRGMVVS